MIVEGAASTAVVGPQILGVAVEGHLDAGTRPLRAIVIGDGDFASNSFLPICRTATSSFPRCGGSHARSAQPPSRRASPYRRSSR